MVRRISKKPLVNSFKMSRRNAKGVNTRQYPPQAATFEVGIWKWVSAHRIFELNNGNWDV